ncbi:MAG: DUF378 domain-containing protein [Lachnospiraceae bacterium]|nr:DUF378 domain-containing protein [Lachnospiraceae bacterium]
MRTLDWLCMTLMIIGSVNWGLVGFFNFDLVTSVFGGSLYWIARIIFGLVGLAGLYSLTLYGRLDSREESKQA